MKLFYSAGLFMLVCLGMSPLYSRAQQRFSKEELIYLTPEWKGEITGCKGPGFGNTSS